MFGIKRDKDDSIKQRMRIAYHVTKAKNINLEYIKIMIFHYNKEYTRAPHCCIILTLLELLQMFLLLLCTSS